MTATDSFASMPAEARETSSDLKELVELLKRYLLQETVEPLKRVAKALAIGSAAALLLGIGLVLLLVAVLRALQTETGSLFAGEWTWAPYFLTVIAGALSLGIAGTVLLRSRRGDLTK